MSNEEILSLVRAYGDACAAFGRAEVNASLAPKGALAAAKDHADNVALDMGRAALAVEAALASLTKGR